MPRAQSVTRSITGLPTAADWDIAVETAVEIDLNGVPLAVMMATPDDLEDLAIGFCLGGTIGLGTAWFAFSIGPFVQFFLRRLSKDLDRGAVA